MGFVLLLIPAAASGFVTLFEALVSTPTDARTLAMGESALTHGTGPLAAFGNPSVLGLSDAIEFSALPPTQWWLNDWNIEEYAFAGPLPASEGRRPRLAFSYRALKFDGLVEDPFTSEVTRLERELESWSLGFGVPIRSWLAAGIDVRHARYPRAEDHATSFDTSVLAMRTVGIPGDRFVQARFVLAVRNWGPDPETDRGLSFKRKADQTFEKVSAFGPHLPTEWALGLGGELLWGPARIQATMELADPIYANSTKEWRQHYGVECLLFAVAALRGGYLNQEEFEDFTYGLGLRIPIIDRLFLSADYARRPDHLQNFEFSNFEPTNFYTFGVSYDLP